MHALYIQLPWSYTLINKVDFDKLNELYSGIASQKIAIHDRNQSLSWRVWDVLWTDVVNLNILKPIHNANTLGE